MAKRSLTTTAKRVKTAAGAVSKPDRHTSKFDEEISVEQYRRLAMPKKTAAKAVAPFVNDGATDNSAAVSKMLDASDESLAAELPEGPMSLNDVIAVLADKGIHPTRESIRGNEKGLTIPVPGGSITVERVKIKKSAGMEELRAYVYGML
jgi:hypothetical protein